MTTANTFIWNELLTVDEAGAREFYRELFGWHCREVDAGSFGIYTLFQIDGRDVAGMMRPTAHDYAGSPPPRWIAYIAVDDASEIATRVRTLGGTVLEGPDDVPGVGRVCMFTDPTGALVYVIQPASSPTGDA
jgi:hypothetical protein